MNWIRQDEIETTEVTKGFRVELLLSERMALWVAKGLESNAIEVDREGLLEKGQRERWIQFEVEC